MKIFEIGQLILDDEWLCPAVPRDDLGKGCEAILAMGETLLRYDDEVPHVRTPKTVGELTFALSSVFPYLSPADCDIVRAGWDTLSSVEHGHVLTRRKRAA